MDLPCLRVVARFSHSSGTPRFQRVLVPTDEGETEFIRATSGHSFVITDDLISLWQNASRDARRTRPAQALPVEPEPVVAVAAAHAGPIFPVGHPDDTSAAPAIAPAASSAAPRGVFEPPEEQGPVPASPLVLPLEHRPIEPKVETPGVQHVSLSDDATP